MPKPKPTAEPTIKRRKLKDYAPHLSNPNKHNPRGLQVIEDSINYNGAGRSGLASKEDTLLIGNGTWEAMARAGIEDVLEVETNGQEWVIVKRNDLSKDDARAVSLMVSDNRANQLDYTPDNVILAELLDQLGQEDTKLVQAAGYNDNDIRDIMNRLSDPDNPYDEWVGMPEFEQEDQLGLKSVIVHFETEDDIAAFAKIVGQPITMSTKYIWYPKQEKLNAKALRVTDES